MSRTVHISGKHPSHGELLELATGVSPSEHVSELLEHVRRCEACETALQTMVADYEQARTRDDLDLDESGLPVLKRIRLKKRTSSIRWTAAIPIAAAAVLTFMLIATPPRSGRDISALPLLPAAMEELRLRNLDPGPDTRMETGLKAYARSDFNTAVALLSDADVEEGTDLARRIYLGSALAHCGRYEAAAHMLENVDARTLPDPWGSEARWTLALIYERLEHTTRADSLLNDLAGETGAVADRARSLLEGRDRP